MQVREAAAAAAGEAMGAVAGVHCAGLHVEQIERQAFQFLGRCCGHLPAFQHQLMRWVYRSAALSQTCALHSAKLWTCNTGNSFVLSFQSICSAILDVDSLYTAGTTSKYP